MLLGIWLLAETITLCVGCVRRRFWLAFAASVFATALLSLLDLAVIGPLIALGVVVISQPGPAPITRRCRMCARDVPYADRCPHCHCPR